MHEQDGRAAKSYHDRRRGCYKEKRAFPEVFHGTSYHIHTVKRSSTVRRQDDLNFQGDVRQADQARRAVGRLDKSNIMNLYK